MVQFYRGGRKVNYSLHTRFESQMKMIRDQWNLFCEKRPEIFAEKKYADLEMYKEPLFGLLGRLTKCSLETVNEYNKLMQSLLELDGESIFHILFLSLNLSECVKVTIKKLFDTWKFLLEKTTLILLEKHKIPANFPDNPETSSPILYYTYSDREDRKKNPEINISFDYPGWCPHASIERLIALLNFPINDLFAEIDFLDLPNIYKKIYKDIEQLFSNLKLSAVPPHSQEYEKRDDKYEELVINFNKVMKLYDFYEPHLREKEAYLINFAENLNRISIMIENDIINTFL